MITPRELKALFEQMEAEGESAPRLPSYDILDQSPPCCAHRYFDGQSAFRKLGCDRDGNHVSQCGLCGEVVEQ